MKPADLSTAGLTPSPATAALCRVAVHGLQLAAGDNAVAGAPVDGEEWHRLLAGAGQQRMLGLLLSAIAEGSIVTTSEQAQQARRECLDALAGDLLRERDLVALSRLLDAEGIEHRVLKGAAVAHLDYPDPALRSFADVDLLVRSTSWDQAMQILQHEGWVRQFPEPRPGFERRFVKSMMLRRPEGGSELDLHRTFVLGPFGLTVRLEDLWEREERFVLGGEYELKALDRETRFLHACFHAALGDLPPRLVPLRDVAQMALSDRLDLTRVLALASAWQAEAVVARAVRLACQLLDLDPAGSATLGQLQALQPPRRQLRALDCYLTPGRSYVRLSLAATRAITSPPEKLRYLVALAAPKREFVAPRYASRRARYGAAMRAVLAGRGRRPSPRSSST